MQIKKIGIVGSGIMGCQIAELFLKYNFDVTLLSRKSEGIKKCLRRFRNKELESKLKTTMNFKDLKNKDLLIESVKEEPKLKQEIFRKLDKLAGSTTIIASNTSSIPIRTMADKCKNRHNMIGIHFSNPVLHMKMVEIVKPDFALEETLNRTLELIKRLDKEPIVVKDVPGFLFNRMMFVMLNEAANALHGKIATKEEIDRIMVLGASHPMGPLRIIDLVGVDVTIDILKNLQKELKENKFAPSPILLKMRKENRLGRKTKRGFYSY